MTYPDILFVPYRDTLELLTTEDAMRICEDVYRMHAKGSVHWSKPPSFKLDVSAPFNNHWHVKGVLMEEPPVTGVRLYNHYDDGDYNNVGYLDCARYIMLSDPMKGHALAIVDEHWSYAVRSTASAIVPCKWLGPKNPKILGLVGVGTMGINALRCLLTLYTFEEIRVTSRRAETRERFATEWSDKLGIPVIAVESPEQVARGADIIVGGTTSNEINCHAEWLKPGSTFISLARRELDPADWPKMDKVVVDDWDLNYLQPNFRRMVDDGVFTRDQLHGTIDEIVTGQKPGRESDDERILIHTTGLVSQDVALAHFIYEQAKARNIGITLPAAR
ncbi:MAG: ornithine cyclodeaminase [Hyphomicrobiales bacterium]|nr:ornithine cyclodeaminase [Hyphomicrobiales bacterium]